MTGEAPAVLLTGMSGTGKSTALRALAGRGCATIDTDDGDWLHDVDGEPHLDAERLEAELDRSRTAPLFVQATAVNQGVLYDLFDAVVLLAAPLDVILDRVRSRTDNPFGRTADDRARIAADHAEVEPLLRRGATHEVDATQAPETVVEQLLRIAAAPDSARRR